MIFNTDMCSCAHSCEINHGRENRT